MIWSVGRSVGLLVGPAIITTLVPSYVSGMQQNIRAIEVWGCSSGRALDQQQSQKNWEEREANKGRIVSREAAFGGGGRGKGARAGWQDNPDRLLLEMGGITTEHNQRSDGC